MFDVAVNHCTLNPQVPHGNDFEPPTISNRIDQPTDQRRYPLTTCDSGRKIRRNNPVEEASPFSKILIPPYQSRRVSMCLVLSRMHSRLGKAPNLVLQSLHPPTPLACADP